MTSSPGIEPGPHWWKASALTTAPSLLPLNPDLPNYKFEYVPTPLSCGGVGIYTSSNLTYNVIEKTSTVAFQAIWVEVQFIKKTSIICGVIYRHHNSPEQFQPYFDDTLEKLYLAHIISLFTSVMGDFNIDLLKSETCGFSHNFLLYVQSFSFVPTIDKPTKFIIPRQH